MTKFFLSLFIVVTCMLTGFDASAANTTTLSSSKVSIKKVKDAGDLHRFQLPDGREVVFQEQADGSWELICIC